jgi:hypothetical protein
MLAKAVYAEIDSLGSIWTGGAIAVSILFPNAAWAAVLMVSATFNICKNLLLPCFDCYFAL